MLCSVILHTIRTTPRVSTYRQINWEEGTIMKKGRKLGSGLLAAALSFSLFTGSTEAMESSKEQEGKDEIRVLIKGSSSTLTKAKNKYQQKQNIGSDGF